MAKFVPYPEEAIITDNAEALLTEFAHARDGSSSGLIRFTIDFDMAWKKYLKLGIEFSTIPIVRSEGFPDECELSQRPGSILRSGILSTHATGLYNT